MTYTAIGLMSGTSMDGVDAAIIKTDGQDHVAVIGSGAHVPYDHTMRSELKKALNQTSPTPSLVTNLTHEHIVAVEDVLRINGMTADQIDFIGFHGHTIDHRPHDKITIQIGDPHQLAKATGIDVIHDFRRQDVAMGGQGAPLIPAYHAALFHDHAKPLAVVNIGGVANITWIGHSDTHDSSNLLAFDTGPGNALIDDWVWHHLGEACDIGGKTALKGTVQHDFLAHWLSHPYFAAAAPKSLDRNAFASFLSDTIGSITVSNPHELDSTEGTADSPEILSKNVETIRNLMSLSLEDGAATLTALTAKSIAHAALFFSEQPEAYYITGGGRHNVALMTMLQSYITVPVRPIEEAGFDGDYLEAQGFAYLAARSIKGLPLSYPSTTGVGDVTSGGTLVAV